MSSSLRIVCVVLVASAAVAVAACGGATSGRRTGSPSASPATRPSPDPVVARVNGDAVRQSDVDLAHAEARLVGRDIGAARALRTAIDGALVAAEARKLGATADLAEVDKRLAAVTSQIGGKAALAAALKKTRMSEAQLRASLAGGVLRQAVQDALYPNVHASAAAVRRFYDRNRAKLFTRPAALELDAFVVHNAGIAGNAVKRLRQGHPFGEVARQFSTDPELKASGGAMGWVDPASMPASLRKAVERLSVGETSPPTKGPTGVWVFQLVHRRPARTVPFSAVRAGIQKGLDGERRSAALAGWLRQARKNALIERF